MAIVGAILAAADLVTAGEVMFMDASPFLDKGAILGAGDRPVLAGIDPAALLTASIVCCRPFQALMRLCGLLNSPVRAVSFPLAGPPVPELGVFSVDFPLKVLEDDSTLCSVTDVSRSEVISLLEGLVRSGVSIGGWSGFAGTGRVSVGRSVPVFGSGGVGFVPSAGSSFFASWGSDGRSDPVGGGGDPVLGCFGSPDAVACTVYWLRGFRGSPVELPLSEPDEAFCWRLRLRRVLFDMIVGGLRS